MKKLLTLAAALIVLQATAQNVGIGTTTPASKLSVGSSSQFQVDSVGNLKKINSVSYSFPSSQGSSGQFLSNNGSGTLSWSSPSTGWSLTGNSGTSVSTNFIGTTDSVPLLFKVNNAKACMIDPNYKNTFLGLRAGNSNSTGLYNTGIGMQALTSNTTGSWNTANGYQTTLIASMSD